MTAPRRDTRVAIEDVIGEFETEFATRDDIAWPAESIVFDHLTEVVDADLLQHFDIEDVVLLRLSMRDADDLRRRVRTWTAEA